MPLIDPQGHTVEVPIKPMDLSDFEPEITVSEFAVVTEPASIENGVAAEYNVTAENGDSVTWTVTINLAYGVRYVFDGTEVVHLHGFIDSTDPDDDKMGLRNSRYRN